MYSRLVTSAACSAVIAVAAASATASTVTKDDVFSFDFVGTPTISPVPQLVPDSVTREATFVADTQSHPEGDGGFQTSIETEAGTFTGLGGGGTGASAVTPVGSIRALAGNNFGRFNVVENPTASSDSDATFLDSNDSDGIEWTIDRGLLDPTGLGVRSFGTFIVDSGDVQGTLTISGLFEFDQDVVAPEWASTSFDIGEILPRNQDSKNERGNVWQLGGNLALLEGWESLTLTFSMEHPGNGFDGFALANSTVGAIPLPAPVLLLLSGVGLLGGLSMRRRRTA